MVCKYISGCHVWYSLEIYGRIKEIQLHQMFPIDMCVSLIRDPLRHSCYIPNIQWPSGKVEENNESNLICSHRSIMSIRASVAVTHFVVHFILNFKQLPRYSGTYF